MQEEYNEFATYLSRMLGLKNEENDEKIIPSSKTSRTREYFFILILR